MTDRIYGAYLGAVVADALTLGTHYEYDAQKIKTFYGGIDRFYAPGEKTGGQTHGIGWGARNYHGGNGRGPPKVAGENTDYGDYNMLVLEHLAATHSCSSSSSSSNSDGEGFSVDGEGGNNCASHPIELEQLIPRWQERLKTWRAWMCTQTKQTLRQVQQGVPLDRLGGRSNAMAIRNAAAFAFYGTEEEVVAIPRRHPDAEEEEVATGRPRRQADAVVVAGASGVGNKAAWLVAVCRKVLGCLGIDAVQR